MIDRDIKSAKESRTKEKKRRLRRWGLNSFGQNPFGESGESNGLGKERPERRIELWKGEEKILMGVITTQKGVAERGGDPKKRRRSGKKELKCWKKHFLLVLESGQVEPGNDVDNGRSECWGQVS